MERVHPELSWRVEKCFVTKLRMIYVESEWTKRYITFDGMSDTIRFTEESLISLWFGKKKDKYEECAEEIEAVFAHRIPRRDDPYTEKVKNTIKKYFPEE